MAGPLSGLRVLDLSRVLAGPWATQLLADLGADIIKVERPGEGDDTRGWGPPFLADANGAPTRESAYFLSANRGKRSICIDLAEPAGQALARELAGRCDILVENYKVGGLAKYGLDYPALRALHPRLIYCSITGFGQTGPDRHRPGYDFLLQGMGGLMSLTGEAEGEPMKVGVAVVDILTGMYAASAILAAVVERAASGEGQHIDLALFDVQLATLANQAMNYLVGGAVPMRMGNTHPNIVPYQAFATRDGFVIVTVGNDTQFARFASACGEAGWADDPRFRTNPARVAHRSTLVPLLEGAMRGRTTAEWVEMLQAAGVPCGPVNTLDAAFAEPQAEARGMVGTHPHGEGTLRAVANPIRLSRSPVGDNATWPGLGEHTTDILASVLGKTPAEMGELRHAGALGPPTTLS